MLRFPSPDTFASKPTFRHSENVEHPRKADDSYRDQPGRIGVEIDGTEESLCFYGREDEHERDNAEIPKTRLEGQLREAGIPHGDWTDIAFRFGRWAMETVNSAGFRADQA